MLIAPHDAYMRHIVSIAAGIALAAVTIRNLRAETAQEIAAGIVYARGGLARIQNIQTERMTGTISIGDQQGSFTREIERPGKLRMEVTLGGNTTIETYNGATGWRLEEGIDRKPARELTAKERKHLAAEADLDGPFVDFEAKGILIEILGKEMLGPSVVWKLKVTFKSGETELYYVESTGYYILRRTSVLDGSVMSDTLYKDFRRVEGVLTPFSVISSTNEGSAPALQFQNVELNIPINETDFARPEGRGTPEPMHFKQEMPRHPTSAK